MKTTGVVRQLDSLGRIVLPIELRRNLEIGPKDIEAGQAVLVRRDTREKRVVELTALAENVKDMLDSMQADMLIEVRDDGEFRIVP